MDLLCCRRSNKSNSESNNQRDLRRSNKVHDREFSENMEILHSSESKETEESNVVTNTDFCVEENSKAHHTNEYDIKDLIVRRGQVFKMIVTFNRPVNAEKEQIILQLATGSRPKQSKNTIIRLEDTKSLSTSSWGMQIVSQQGATVEMSVMSPADAFVGVYTVYLETKTKGPDGKDNSHRQLIEKKIYILFNAWCKEDSVFMENEQHRQEYVLNDHGRIWVGTKKSFHPIPWNIGQFDSVCLETCLSLLDSAGVKAEARGSPVRICRVISQMVNSKDNDGVLVGNWSGDYSDGASPSSWAGSVAILEQYSKTKKSVKYGQCWVFSGLTTTLLRAIGIPTRSVTNFQSAHDNDKSMTIDYHYDEEGNPLHFLNDSIWNFHVWNESFLTRPVLPPGYDGWQAHDATPQETSEGVFQCGPCPLKAIKNGEVYLPYDTGFVFAEVNGDMVSWNVDVQGEMSVESIDKRYIGKFISTKAVGSNEREDLTNMYKFREGTQDERNAVRLANQHSSRKDEDIYPPQTSHDVDFEIKTMEKVILGDDFDIKLAVKNTSREPRTVKVAIVAKTSFYIGAVSEDVKDMSEVITIPGNEETTTVLPVLVGEYVKMSSDTTIKIFFHAKVEETGQVFGAIDDVDFTKPELEAHIPDRVNMHERFQVTFTFTNPLPVKLTNGKLNLEGRGMLPSTLTETVGKEIGPHAKVSIPVNMAYILSGRLYLDAVFHSDQLSGINGEYEINVS